MNPNPDQPQRDASGRIALRSIFVVVAVASVAFAVSRPSPLAMVLSALAILFTVATMFIKQVRGEVVVILLFGVPALIVVAAYCTQLVFGE